MIDALAVYKDAEGNLEAEHLSNLTEDEAIEMGSKIGALIGLGFAGEEGAEAGALAGAEAAEDGESLLAEDEVPGTCSKTSRPTRPQRWFCSSTTGRYRCVMRCCAPADSGSATDSSARSISSTSAWWRPRRPSNCTSSRRSRRTGVTGQHSTNHRSIGKEQPCSVAVESPGALGAAPHAASADAADRGAAGARGTTPKRTMEWRKLRRLNSPVPTLAVTVIAFDILVIHTSSVHAPEARTWSAQLGVVRSMVTARLWGVTWSFSRMRCPAGRAATGTASTSLDWPEQLRWSPGTHIR